jgi:hypothetical protein
MSTIDLVPECNLGIEVCKNGTKERNAVFLATETDYMVSLQTVNLPYPNQLFRFIYTNNNAGIVIE